jgi:hypothetical protein
LILVVAVGIALAGGAALLMILVVEHTTPLYTTVFLFTTMFVVLTAIAYSED